MTSQTDIHGHDDEFYCNYWVIVISPFSYKLMIAQWNQQVHGSLPQLMHRFSTIIVQNKRRN